MKKISLGLIVMGLLFITGSSQLKASNNVNNNLIKKENVNETKIAKQLLVRLYEIKELDKTNLTNLEKLTLKNEIKDIKNKLAPLSGGIYLSVGTIILILILLIIFT